MGTVTAGIAKAAAGAAVKPTLGLIMRQVTRRGAPFADLDTLRGADRELDEALSVLQGGASGLAGAVVARLKGFASDRPDTFADGEAKSFIRDERVVALVKSGARKVVRGEAIDAERAKARALRAELVGGDGLFGETLLEDAVAFAAMTLLGHLTPAERQVMELVGDVRDEMRNGFAQVMGRFDELGASAAGGAVDAEPFDDAVRAGVRRLQRRRMLPIPSLPDDAVAFAGRVETALRLASANVRAKAFTEAATLLIRAERVDEALPWLDRAEALGADVTTLRARIAMSEDRSNDALRMLRDGDDALSRGLLLDAIARRDGDAAALAHFEAKFRPSDLTGHALQVTATRLLLAGDADGAAALLEGATPGQFEENPVLLYVRARHRLSGSVPPDIGGKLMEHEGMLPRATDLHDDAAGRARLAGARLDLERLTAVLPDLDAPGFAELIDVNLTALQLCSSDLAERELARSDFAARLADPAQTVHLVPLAKQYGVEVDWAPLRAALASAERLGGLDDAQLRAAFTVVMDEGEPAEIADFVHRHRERLEDYSTSDSVVAIEIEALAKAGRPDDAKALLAAERVTIGEATAEFLETTFAELEGADTVPARLAQFDASGSTHDLEVLISVMRRRRDARLGGYLARLWRLSRQVADARRACEAFLDAGEEQEAEAFLDELGGEALSDPTLRVHVAWARYRQGRLDEAEAELAALRSAGFHDPNVRHLEMLLWIETGRWSELGGHVRRELAARADRTADELLSAARIARSIGDVATMDLLRAATAVDPGDARVAVQAYTLATEAGVERSLEVGGWLALAIADQEASGLWKAAGLDEVIAMMADSRAEAERIGGLINSAAVPLFMGIDAAGGTQSALVIRQMAGNAMETDARRRSVVPLFAGNRMLRTDLRPALISLDPLAILVLDQLGLLDAVIDAMPNIVLPSGTLHSFFEDLGKAAHSQPSRVVQAKRIREEVASALLSVLDDAAPAGDGSVDPEFAMLHAAAVARDGFVVDTAPLHPQGRLDVTVDSAPYADRLLSPAGLVAALGAAGAISRTAAKAAEAAVAGSGERFPTEPTLIRGRPLFISNLAVHYLSDAGLLTDLKAFAGGLLTSRVTTDLADREIAQGAAAEAIRAGIERVRATLARAIAEGCVRIGPARRSKDEFDRARGRRDHMVMMSPVVSVMRDAAGIDAFVCDDRAMNRYLETTDRTGSTVAFLTTPDLLGILRGMDAIDDDAVDAARERLRRSGAGLMLVDPDEMRRAVRTSDWRVGPNAELRAIRDSIHLPIARKVLQLPAERPWLQAVSLSIAYAIRNAWIELEEDDLAERAADWLLDLLPDPAALSAADGSPDREAWVSEVTRFSVWAFAAMFDLRDGRVERHRRWFAEKVEPLVRARDAGAVEAVARTLYASLTAPLNEADDDGE